MSDNPRILILAPIQHHFPPQGYGPWELISYNLAEGLVDIGADVTVFTTKNAETRAKVKCHWDSEINEKDENNQSATLIHISEALREAKNYDIIHNHLNIEPVLMAKLLGVNMVTTLHGAACEANRHLLHEYLKGQNFVSISYAERNFAEYLNYIGNVYNGVDFSKYQLARGNGEYLLFSGRIEEIKGIEESIELSRKSGIPLKIAGVITNKDYYTEKVEPNLESGKIEYLGNLAYQELAQVLNKALALTNFIRWNEPFGLSVLDALATGIPVIGYKKGAVPELIYDDRMGIVVESVDQALEALKRLSGFSPEVIRNLAQERFDRKKMAEGYLNIYRQLT